MTTDLQPSDQIAKLRRELEMCEEHARLLRDLIRLQPAPFSGNRRPARSGGRPNAGISRFLLRAVQQKPGLDVSSLTRRLAEMGFCDTPTRTLKQVIEHEIGALVRRRQLHVDGEGIYAGAAVR